MATTPAPPNQVSDFKLRFSYWYVTHALQLKKMLAALLIILSVGFYGTTLYGVIVEFGLHGRAFNDQMNQLSSDLIDYQGLYRNGQPQPVVLVETESIPSGDTHSDVVVKLSNPNHDWVAQSVVVELDGPSGVAARKTTFIYPGQEKYMAFFNVEGVTDAASAVRLGAVDWQRYVGFDQYAAPRLDITADNSKLTTGAGGGVAGGPSGSVLSFDVTNHTAYSYWQVGLMMTLLSGSGVGGANYFSVDQLRAGETRHVEVRWTQSLPPIVETNIQPEVDILNPAVYMAVQ